jgi:hypothetical protein
VRRPGDSGQYSGRKGEERTRSLSRDWEWVELRDKGESVTLRALEEFGSTSGSSPYHTSNDRAKSEMRKCETRGEVYFTVDWFGLVLQTPEVSANVNRSRTPNTPSGGTASCSDVSEGGWKKDVSTTYSRYS